MTKRVKQEPPNILGVALTERQSRSVAAWLKRNSYDATVELCRRKSVIEIAAYFTPLTPTDRPKLEQDLLVAAGMVPRKEGRRKDDNRNS